MGNENIKNDINNLQKIMLNILDDNDKMKGDISKLKEENKKISSNMTELNNEIKELEDRVEYLEDKCQDIWEVLGKIQKRDLSKNFLRFFKTYLTQEDLNDIRKNKKLRGEIILKRIKELFPEAKEKN